MKKLIKLSSAILSMMMLFSFFACSTDTEEDDELVVSISASDNDSSTTRTITMSAPSKYSGIDVYIVYTLDGSEPSISYDGTAIDTDFISYGTAIKYDSQFTVSDSVQIKAKACYLKNMKVYVGPLASKTVTVKSSIDTSKSETAPVSGNYTFKLASSGNSLFTHYFDTSASDLFKWGDYDHCYYQIQFSYKSAGKGNWYLFVRQVGNATPIKGPDGTTNFVAQGSYTGTCFDNRKSDSVNNGDLTLSCEVGGKAYEGKYSVSDNSITMKVSVDASSDVSVGDAK
ncbi:hypothetical protein [uncultured Treponema sp.]|uniref:hypothetical protein n=1 Tax=uncultured Treponema sp. TaxID=162155 RepID=UPI0025EB80B7|nr:hypothetical protein [uncultured Treponema sp.]